MANMEVEIMKRLIIYIILLCASVGITQAQNVGSVSFYQEGKNVIVTYYLDKSAVAVFLTYSEDGGRTFSAPLKYVSGDVGKNISPGYKRIVWDVLKECDKLVGNRIVFQVEAVPMPTTVKPQTNYNYSSGYSSYSSSNYKSKNKRTGNKYNSIGDFDSHHFQMYLSGALTIPSCDYVMDMSCGWRAKKFFYMGAYLGLHIYDMADDYADDIYVYGEDAADYNYDVLMGLHLCGYIPCGFSAVKKNIYPYVSATIGGGFDSGLYYDVGLGVDYFDSWLTTAIGYCANGFYLKFGCRFGRK